MDAPVPVYGVLETEILECWNNFQEYKAELWYKGTKCIGKGIRLPKVDLTPEQGSLYWKECMLHAHLRHPHIVQFLGYYIRPEGRYLVQVTELLSSTVGECIDRNGVLPNEISHSILNHVALGLRYLHERLKPIIHRDLTAKHVYLMDDMTAKIGDFASAKVLTPETSNNMLPLPGMPDYMPPEAVPPSPNSDVQYDTKLDVFSYGVLMVHILSGKWPHGLEVALSEADRRQVDLDAISSEHPLMGLILQCLNNSPSDRPTAKKIFETVSNTFSSSKLLEAVYKLKRQERNRSAQHMCSKKYERILIQAIESIPTSEIVTFLSTKLDVSASDVSLPFQDKHLINASSNYLNYHLVMDMVEQLGDESLKDEMKRYCSELKKFRMGTTVSDFVTTPYEEYAEKMEPLRDNYTELTVKLGKDSKVVRMEDIEKLRQTVAHNFSLPSHAVLFYMAEEGSIVVKYWIKTASLDQCGEGVVNLRNQENVLEIRVDGDLLKMYVQKGDLSLEAEIELQQQHETDGTVQQLNRLREDNLALTATLEENISTLKKENATLKEKNSTLKTENAALQEEISALRRENAALQNEKKIRKTPRSCDSAQSFPDSVASEVDVPTVAVDDSTVDDSLLSQDHLYEIMPFLHDLNKENVHLLGLALGISQRRLNTKDVASFLREVIADWLNGVDMVNETSGQPSWRSLVSALRHPIVRQTGIANNIAVAKKLKF